MNDRLLHLAAQPDSDSRRDLLRSVAEMFYADGRDHLAERELRTFTDVVTRVLKDLPEVDRSAFSQSVAADPRTPHGVAVALANDTLAVATPVIQNSPMLTDDDLIAIANHQGLDHRLAISRRPNINERVTDALVDFDETEVMASILDNETARTSERALNKIADRAVTVEKLREQLSFRQNTPASVLTRLLPYLEGKARERAVAVLEHGGASLGSVAAQADKMLAMEKGDAARRRLHIKALAARVGEGGVAIGDFVDDCLSFGRPLDLALGLSLVSLLPEKQVANAVISTDVQPLNLLCKALELDAGIYERIDAMRRSSVKLSADVPKSVLDEYGRLDVANAQRVMRFVKVRTTLAAAG